MSCALSLSHDAFQDSSKVSDLFGGTAKRAAASTIAFQENKIFSLVVYIIKLTLWEQLYKSNSSTEINQKMYIKSCKNNNNNSEGVKKKQPLLSYSIHQKYINKTHPTCKEKRSHKSMNTRWRGLLCPPQRRTTSACHSETAESQDREDVKSHQTKKSTLTSEKSKTDS